jgi:hypothetical protein
MPQTLRGIPMTMLMAMGMVIMLVAFARPASATVRECLLPARLPITVRIGATPPVNAWLEGGNAPALRVVDAESGRVLWSADAMPPVSQEFPAMQADFAGSLTLIDLDGDGLQDRIYAGDTAGRLWRFDLHHGANALRWASGGLFADFSSAEGRGFVAAPDVSLVAPAGVAPWFNIALGTASLGATAASNRFYVLRDHAPFQSWSDADYRDWQPLRDTDLLRIEAEETEPPEDTAAAELHFGYFIELGNVEVLTGSLTVAGRAVFAMAQSVPQTAAGCRAATNIATLDLAHGTLGTFDMDDGPRWQMPLAQLVRAGTDFSLTVVGSAAACTLDEQPIPACDLDLAPRRTWWRREDAE